MNLRRLWAIARKEALHIRRDPRSLGLAIGIPMLMIVLFGYALTVDVNNVPIVAWDQSSTKASRDYLAQFTGSRYFDFRGTVASYRELERAIDTRAAYLALVIPPDFAATLAAGRAVEVQAIIDGSDSNTAAIVLATRRASPSASIRRSRSSRSVAPSARVRRPRSICGHASGSTPISSRRTSSSPAHRGDLGLIAALLTSLTIAREWERGTMEQLISTPVKPAELILGKLLPYFVIGMLDVIIAILMAVFLFDVPLRGSVSLLLAMAAIFIVGTLSQGILISTLARAQLLASQLAMVSKFLPAFLLSGFMFAIVNMPVPVQVITYIVPARYFVALVKGIYLRGVGLETLWLDAVFLVAFAVVVSGLAIVKFKKRLV